MRMFAVAMLAGVAAACTSQPVFTQLIEARRSASELHVQFAQSAEAANRAVMADTDDEAAAAGEEARHHRRTIERDVDALRAVLQPLGYEEDLHYLDGFRTCFDEYRRLNDEILPLAVENTNVKAQRLSFGPAREAADAFRSALARALKEAGGGNQWEDEALATRAIDAVLQILVLQAPHIAEADLVAMTRTEEQMTALDADARTALQQLEATLPPAAAPEVGEARAALDRFAGINKELIALSRRNSDVRSLALSLGDKRTITARCEDQLRALEEALAKHQFTATR